VPRGQADFGMYAAKETVSGLADLGELAARLKSPVTFDRRGDVLWLDDFEGTEGKWILSGTGTGKAYAHSAESARYGLCSMKLTAGDAATNHAQMATSLPYPVLSKIGMEISFTYNAGFGEYLWTFRLYDGSDYYEGRVRFTWSTLAWEIDDHGTWRLLKTGSLTQATYLYHTIKIVLDFTTKKYVRVILNEVEYDVSAYSLATDDSIASAQLRAEIRVTNRSAENMSAYFDSFIVTQNEP